MLEAKSSHKKEATVKRIELVTDGSCAGNPGPGGWLRRVTALWPQCSPRLSDDGNFLLVQPVRNAQLVVPSRLLTHPLQR